MKHAATPIPRVTRGPRGLLTVLNTIIDAVNDIREWSGDGRFIAVKRVGRSNIIEYVGPIGNGRDEFEAVITGSASLGTYQWKYAWTEVRPDGDGYATFDGARSGTTSSGYATNDLEINHTADYAWGVKVTGDDYPASMAPRPVGGGGDDDTHKYDVPVRMRRVVDVNGSVKYRFKEMGSHDGTCS